MRLFSAGYGELIASLRDSRGHELVPFTGQTTGMIGEVLPAGEIVRGLVTEAEETLKTAPSLSHLPAIIGPRPITICL